MLFQASTESIPDLGHPDAEPPLNSNIVGNIDGGASTITTSEDEDAAAGGQKKKTKKSNKKKRPQKQQTPSRTVNAAGSSNTSTMQPNGTAMTSWGQQPLPPPQSNASSNGYGGMPLPVAAGANNANTARSTATLRRLTTTLQGRQILYETTGDDETLIPCRVGIYTINVQFYEHAVMIRTRDKKCCFPSSKSMVIVPRYKLTDVQTGSGARPLPWWTVLLNVAGLAVFVCAFVFVSVDYYGERLETFNTALLVTGILLMVVGCFLVYHYKFSGKAYHYNLIYSSGGKGSLASRRIYSLFAVSNEKVDEDFLYSYVYETIEHTKDPKFLHRFTHLNQAGLMDPTHGDKRQLVTKLRPAGGGAGLTPQRSTSTVGSAIV